MPKGLQEQWHLHSVPRVLCPLGRDPSEPGMLLPQALASGWGPLKFSPSKGLFHAQAACSRSRGAVWGAGDSLQVILFQGELC